MLKVKKTKKILNKLNNFRNKTTTESENKDINRRFRRINEHTDSQKSDRRTF